MDNTEAEQEDICIAIVRCLVNKSFIADFFANEFARVIIDELDDF